MHTNSFGMNYVDVFFGKVIFLWSSIWEVEFP